MISETEESPRAAAGSRTKKEGQRQAICRLLEEHGYDRERVIAGYARDDAARLIQRSSKRSGVSSSATYAATLWRTGHSIGHGRWILKFCAINGIPTPGKSYPFAAGHGLLP